MTPSGRTITLLGRVAIEPERDGPVAAVRRGRRAELVFAYLAAEHHRVVSHDELAEALWPEGLPETWEAALRGVLTEVRRFLADSGLDPAGILTTAHRGYQLQLPGTFTVDLDVARDGLAAARSDLATGAADSAARHAARASSLAQLPFLTNHDGEWVDGVRRELETIGARALEVEARAHAQAGDLTAAATAAERLVHAEPFNEAAHQLRIRILGQAADRSGAMKAYEHCRAVLADGLGVEPSEQTTAAYREATQAAPPPSPPAPTGTAVLVVEDHDFQRRTVAVLLRNLGVSSVTEASDGVAALAMLEGGLRPDIIVCDIDMPGMDGVDFIRHVADGDLAGAVIIASGLDAKVIQAVGEVGEGYGLQVLGALEKPLTARRLGDLLAKYRPRPRSSLHRQSELTTGAARAALEDGRISFCLEPAFDVATGGITAASVVPRWEEPDSGQVPPAAFVPLVERELSARAVDVAAEHLGRFAAAGLQVALSVDLAPDDLRDASLPDRLAAAIVATGGAASQLTCALDERTFRTDPGVALGLLTRLRVKGCGVALSGFGSGRAAAAQLGRAPLTEVRLARSLLDAATETGDARPLEDAIDFARRLDVTVVGVGCDTEENLQLLLARGCDRLQGAVVGEALPGDEFARWVGEWSPDRLQFGDRS